MIITFWDMFLIYLLFLTNYKSAALWSPRDHYIYIISNHKGNTRKREGGRPKSDDVLKFQLSEALFQNWTFINVLFCKPEVEI